MGQRDICAQRARLQETLEECEAEIALLPVGSLVCSRDKRGLVRYYQAFRDESGKYRRLGIGKKEALKRELARKGYLESVARALEHNMRVLERASSQYIDCDPAALIDRVRDGLKGFSDTDYVCTRINRILLDLDGSDEKRIASHAAWGQAPYERSTRYGEALTLLTSHGERMRSKSEVLIAEKLYVYGIPFRYEQVLDIEGVEFAPDFTFEGNDGQEFYLEFCGMMDDAEYVAAHQRKRAIYEQAGLTEWGRMMYVYASGNEINMAEIDALIRFRIIPRL